MDKITEATSNTAKETSLIDSTNSKALNQVDMMMITYKYLVSNTCSGIYNLCYSS